MLAYKRILVPVDFSDISRSAISQAANHSEASESELLVVHIVDDSVQSSDTDLRIRDAESQLTDLLDSLEIGTPANYKGTKDRFSSDGYTHWHTGITTNSINDG